MVQRSALVGFMLLLASASLFPASRSAVTSSATRQPAFKQGTPLKPADWGAPPVDVSHDGRTWVIAGQKQRVTLSESDLSTTIQASGVTWKMVPSGSRDLLVRVKGEVKADVKGDVKSEGSWLRLADARSIRIVPYRTGFKSGVKITL